MGACKADECDRKTIALGLCGKHYQRLKLMGDANAKCRFDLRDPYEELLRFGFERYGECLLSKAREGAGGYRRVQVNKVRHIAHRLSYEKWYGPIPAGYVIDHMCHNEAAERGECDGKNCRHRACVNPAHLRAVLQSVNAAASPLWRRAQGWRKEITHCPQGHEYSEENTYLNPNVNSRACIICMREANARSYLKKKARLQ